MTEDYPLKAEADRLRVRMMEAVAKRKQAEEEIVAIWRELSIHEHLSSTHGDLVRQAMKDVEPDA